MQDTGLICLKSFCRLSYQHDVTYWIESRLNFVSKLQDEHFKFVLLNPTSAQSATKFKETDRSWKIQVWILGKIEFHGGLIIHKTELLKMNKDNVLNWSRKHTMNIPRMK